MRLCLCNSRYDRRFHGAEAPSYSGNHMTETKFNILVLGGGGREHALCWKIAGSPHCAAVLCTGNGGMAAVAENIHLDEKDHDAVVAFCRENTIALVVIGPEAPLATGWPTPCRPMKLPLYPGAAAQLEGSKGFTRIYAEANIPTAAYGRFIAPEPAHDYLNEQALPIAIKADGLAAGGEDYLRHHDAAHEAIDYIFDGAPARPEPNW